MVKARGTKERRLNQLTLVSTPYVTQLVRTVAHVRSIVSGETISMAEVFRSIVEKVGPELEGEIAVTLGKKAVLPLVRLREAEKAGADLSEVDVGEVGSAPRP